MYVYHIRLRAQKTEIQLSFTRKLQDKICKNNQPTNQTNKEKAKKEKRQTMRAQEKKNRNSSHLFGRI